MAAFSKYFLETVNVRDCTEIIHDGTCLESTIWNFTRTISGCTKFVLPLALVMRFRYFDCAHLSRYLHFCHFAVADHNENKKNRQKCTEAELEDFYRLLFGCLADQRFRPFSHLLFPVKKIESMFMWSKSEFMILNWKWFRKVFGPFSYFSVLAYPGGLGAAVCASVLAERVIYTYAHGLSTIVSEMNSILQKSLKIGGVVYIFRHSKYRSIAAIFTFLKFCAIHASQSHWHLWHAIWCCCMDCEKINRAASIGWFSHWNESRNITTSGNRVRSWMSWRQPFAHNWNCAIMNAIAIHTWKKYDFLSALEMSCHFTPFLNAIAGHPKIFAVWPWTGNCTKFNFQLQFDTQATDEYFTNIF